MHFMYCSGLVLFSCGLIPVHLNIMTSSSRNIFRVTGHLCGEFTGHRWIPHTKASNAELWFLFICAWINVWVNNSEAVDLRRHRAHYNAIVMNGILQSYFAGYGATISLTKRIQTSTSNTTPPPTLSTYPTHTHPHPTHPHTHPTTPFVWNFVKVR